MNEQQFANKIRQALNESARLDGKMSPRVIERLRAARERALERRRVAAGGAREPAYAWAGNVMGRFGGLSGISFRLLLPTALLVAGLVAIYNWQQEQRAADVEELDAQLLTDDLPIDAYLDRGFEAWLKKTSAR